MIKLLHDVECAFLLHSEKQRIGSCCPPPTLPPRNILVRVLPNCFKQICFQIILAGVCVFPHQSEEPHACGLS